MSFSDRLDRQLWVKNNPYRCWLEEDVKFEVLGDGSGGIRYIDMRQLMGRCIDTKC